MGNLNMFKEKEKQACLTKGSYAGCHTRWRGLESPLLLALRLAAPSSSEQKPRFMKRRCNYSPPP